MSTATQSTFKPDEWSRQEVKLRKINGVCGRNSVVECQLPKLDVVGSNPIARSFHKSFRTRS